LKGMTEIASAAGTTLVDKHALFRQADFVTIHLVLSRRTAGLVGAAELMAGACPDCRLAEAQAFPKPGARASCATGRA
jgi:hypothetical protein